ncbi:MAG: hypothetical protein WCP28_03845 [Actinomycetes bacterium]
MDFFELRDWVCAHAVRLPGEVHQGHVGAIEDDEGRHWKKGKVLEPSELPNQLELGARFFVILGYDYPPWALNSGCELEYLDLMQSEWANPNERTPQGPGDNLALELILAGPERPKTRAQTRKHRDRPRAVLIEDGFD